MKPSNDHTSSTRPYSAALHGVAARAAAAPSGVMAALAASAAAGAMLRDVHDLLRGGRGAVVTALADVHRMVCAAAAADQAGGSLKTNSRTMLNRRLYPRACKKLSTRLRMNLLRLLHASL